MDRHLRQHHNHKQASERTLTETASGLQQTHRHAERLTQDIRENLSHILWSHGKLLRATAEANCRAAEEPAFPLNRTKDFQALGRDHLTHYTNGNVLTVKKLLGHKRVENMMMYIGMIQFKDEEF